MITIFISIKGQNTIINFDNINMIEKTQGAIVFTLNTEIGMGIKKTIVWTYNSNIKQLDIDYKEIQNQIKGLF